MSYYQKELKRIKWVLEEHPRGLTITDISKILNINRNSVAKYLDVMTISGQAEMRHTGPAKVFFRSQRVPISTMLNFSSDYILVLDDYLNISTINDNFLKLMSTERESVLGQSIERCHHPLFRDQEILSRIKEALESEDSAIELKFQVAGEDLYFRTKITPTTFDEGSLGVTLILANITERRNAEEALKERVKELTCLYRIAQLVEQYGLDLEELLQGIVSLIPPAWQYPDITCARIIVNERIFQSANFKETDWKQSADLKVHGKRVGAIEIFYMEKRPERYEGQFLREERNLIDTISERLARIIERIRDEEIIRALEVKYPAVVARARDQLEKIAS